MGKERILIFTAMASLGLAACGTSSPGGNANAPTKVQIAAEGPFTGDEASIGAGALRGFSLAVKNFKDKAGVHGTKANLVSWDDNHKAKTAPSLKAKGTRTPPILGSVGP